MIHHGKKAVVIGSGAGGLATAVRLRRKGFEVTVFEAGSRPGGKATSIEKDGFFFGFGPSLFTFPQLLDDLFILCGKNPADYYSYSRIDPVCNYFYPDGIRLSAFADKEKFARELEDKTGEPSQNVLRHLKNIGEVYHLTKDIFLYNSVHKLKTYLNTGTLEALFKLSKIGINQSMIEANRRQFKTDHVIQLFNRYATYNGSDPYLAPSTLNVIAHPEYNEGGYFLSGGMPDLSKNLHRLAVEMGVNFRFESRVTEIQLKGEKVCGVKLGEESVPADIVVSNMDVQYVYRELLKNHLPGHRALKEPLSTSAMIFYWGIRGSFPELDLHNIFFSSDYRKEFDHLTRLKTIADDATVYVFISSKMNPSHAPEGCENWFTLINVPSDSGQDWSQLREKARQSILRRLSDSLGTDIQPLIISETVNDPVTICRQTLSYSGALYGSSSNNKYAAFLRHPNFLSEVGNLYFTGGSVHPGGGIPLCLLSAKIVDEIIG